MQERPCTPPVKWKRSGKIDSVTTHHFYLEELVLVISIILSCTYGAPLLSMALQGSCDLSCSCMVGQLATIEASTTRGVEESWARIIQRVKWIECLASCR